MKLAILWAVAACVAALDLPCEEYCSCLSSGFRDVEYQPGCDCMYEETGFVDNIDNSGIYYEPAAYVPLPAFIYNHPFYIINPILHLRENNSTNTPQQTINKQHKHTKQVSDPHEFSAEIEIDIDNSRSTHKRKEKDIRVNRKISNSPLYLDINIKAENSERSASADAFTADGLRQTEQSLLECAELHALLNYRKKNNIKHLNTREQNQLFKYDHLSNEDLLKAIDNKCLHISTILQKSLNEIKENRPKKVNTSLSISKEYQENKELLGDTDVLTQHNADMITEANLQQPVHINENSRTVSQHYNENKDYTDVISTEREPEQHEVKKYTLPTQLSTTTVTSTSTEGTATLADTSSKKDAEEISIRNPDISTERYPSFTSNYIDNEYPFQTENILYEESIHSDKLSTPPNTNKEAQGTIGNRRSNNEVHKENRNRYKEEDVSLVKVITHEFSNNTVQSYINGTEEIPNDDFKSSNSYDNNESIMTETESTDAVRRLPVESDIYGNLYFLVNKHQIPARFVQKPNGSVHIGIDAITICDKFKQDGEFVSKFFSSLCKCYESDNCKSLQD